MIVPSQCGPSGENRGLTLRAARGIEATGSNVRLSVGDLSVKKKWAIGGERGGGKGGAGGSHVAISVLAIGISSRGDRRCL